MFHRNEDSQVASKFKSTEITIIDFIHPISDFKNCAERLKWIALFVSAHN